MELKLTQVQTHRMLLTPQMRQALHILQLPLAELAAVLQLELTQNPLLEEAEPTPPEGDGADPPQADDSAPVAAEDPPEGLFPEVDRSAIAREQERQRFREQLVTKPPSLHDHLLSQLGLTCTSAESYRIGEYLIGHLNDDGYLEASVEEVAALIHEPPDRVEAVLHLLHTFDPVGVGARSPMECLLLQLRARGRERSLAARIVLQGLDDLEHHRFSKLATRCHVAEDEIRAAAREIACLEPKPGRVFSTERPFYITPEAEVRKTEAGYELTLSTDELPRLRVNPAYLTLLNDRTGPSTTRAYVRERLAAAHGLLRAVQQRQDTIRRVVTDLLEVQREFLDHGIEGLKPLTLKELADRVGVHESTVSRVVSGKYLQTPFGVLPLREFFSGGIKRTEGPLLSTEVLKATLRRLIEEEHPTRPLSDDAIARHFRSNGLLLARRTIAKYRAELKIPPYYQRRQ